MMLRVRTARFLALRGNGVSFRNRINYSGMLLCPPSSRHPHHISSSSTTTNLRFFFSSPSFSYSDSPYASGSTSHAYSGSLESKPKIEDEPTLPYHLNLRRAISPLERRLRVPAAEANEIVDNVHDAIRKAISAQHHDENAVQDEHSLSFREIMEMLYILRVLVDHHFHFRLVNTETSELDMQKCANVVVAAVEWIDQAVKQISPAAVIIPALRALEAKQEPIVYERDLQPLLQELDVEKAIFKQEHWQEDLSNAAKVESVSFFIARLEEARSSCFRLQPWGNMLFVQSSLRTILQNLVVLRVFRIKEKSSGFLPMVVTLANTMHDVLEQFEGLQPGVIENCRLTGDYSVYKFVSRAGAEFAYFTFTINKWQGMLGRNTEHTQSEEALALKAAENKLVNTLTTLFASVLESIEAVGFSSPRETRDFVRMFNRLVELPKVQGRQYITKDKVDRVYAVFADYWKTVERPTVFQIDAMELMGRLDKYYFFQPNDVRVEYFQRVEACLEKLIITADVHLVKRGIPLCLKLLRHMDPKHDHMLFSPRINVGLVAIFPHIHVMTKFELLDVVRVLWMHRFEVLRANDSSSSSSSSSVARETDSAAAEENVEHEEDKEEESFALQEAEEEEEEEGAMETTFGQPGVGYDSSFDDRVLAELLKPSRCRRLVPHDMRDLFRYLWALVVASPPPAQQKQIHRLVDQCFLSFFRSRIFPNFQFFRMTFGLPSSSKRDSLHRVYSDLDGLVSFAHEVCTLCKLPPGKGMQQLTKLAIEVREEGLVRKHPSSREEL